MKVSKFKALINFKLTEKQNNIKMSISYDCHSIPADCANLALDGGKGTGKLSCFISRFSGVNNVLLSQ